jgi:serine/threonine protein kinase
MCRIEENFYILPSGEVKEEEAAFPCDKVEPGQLCANLRRIRNFHKGSARWGSDSPSPLPRRDSKLQSETRAPSPDSQTRSPLHTRSHPPQPQARRPPTSSSRTRRSPGITTNNPTGSDADNNDDQDGGNDDVDQEGAGMGRLIQTFSDTYIQTPLIVGPSYYPSSHTEIISEVGRSNKRESTWSSAYNVHPRPTTQQKTAPGDVLPHPEVINKRRKLPTNTGRSESHVVEALQEANRIADECGWQTVHTRFVWDGAPPTVKPMATERGMLGRSAKNEVEEVKMPGFASVMARKRIFIERAKHAAARDRKQIRAEVDNLRSLHHKHIVKVLGCYAETVGKRQTFCVLIFPAAEEDLDHFLCERCQPASDEQKTWIGTWFGCLASALAYMHSQGVHHEDIKPSNIVHCGRNVYFTDFGSSRRLEADQDTSTDTPALASKMFAAPEAMPEAGKLLGHGSKTDVYSLGLVFVEMHAVYLGKDLSQMRDSFFGVSTQARRYSNVIHKVAELLGQTYMWLSCLKGMLHPTRQSRPSAQEVVETLSRDRSSKVINHCSCQGRHNTDAHSPHATRRDPPTVNTRTENGRSDTMRYQSDSHQLPIARYPLGPPRRAKTEVQTARPLQSRPRFSPVTTHTNGFPATRLRMVDNDADEVYSSEAGSVGDEEGRTGTFGPSQARAGEHPLRQPRGPPSIEDLREKPTTKHEGSKNFATRQRRQAVGNPSNKHRNARQTSRREMPSSMTQSQVLTPTIDPSLTLPASATYTQQPSNPHPSSFYYYAHQLPPSHGPPPESPLPPPNRPITAPLPHRTSNRQLSSHTAYGLPRQSSGDTPRAAVNYISAAGAAAEVFLENRRHLPRTPRARRRSTSRPHPRSTSHPYNTRVAQKKRAPAPHVSALRHVDPEYCSGAEDYVQSESDDGVYPTSRRVKETQPARLCRRSAQADELVKLSQVPTDSDSSDSAIKDFEGNISNYSKLINKLLPSPAADSSDSKTHTEAETAHAMGGWDNGNDGTKQTSPEEADVPGDDGYVWIEG